MMATVTVTTGILTGQQLCSFDTFQGWSFISLPLADEATLGVLRVFCQRSVIIYQLLVRW
jgi:hypothetical protein